MKSIVKKLAMGSAFGLVALISGEQAEAAESTSNLVVTATVLSNCNIEAAPLSFGNYNPASATAATTSADLSVDCTNGKAFSIDLGAGANAPVVGVGNRSMVSPTTLQALGYQLAYAGTPAVGYTAGADIGADQTFVTGTGDGYVGNFASGAQVFQIDGTIPAGQGVDPGTDYTDTVVATLTY